MKILFLSHSSSITGGAEQCLLEYIDVLVAKGYTCKVMMPKKGEMAKVLSEKKIGWTVIGYGWAIRPHRKVRPHRIISSTGNSLVKIFQEVEKYKPDLIITNTSVIPWGLYAGRTFNIPTVMLIHEILSDKDPSLDVVPNYREYAEIINQNADYVVYNSKFVKKEFSDALKLPKTSRDILYPLPPLDKAKIDTLYKENKINKILKIAIFGVLSPRKNQLEALRAAKILKDRGITNFNIDLYGDKSTMIDYTKQLRRFISENGLKDTVKIKGFTSNVYETMNEYNVVLSTATYEPFGRTIIEGQLFGRIAVTNNTGGGIELVNDLETGLTYPLGRPEQLADKIEWILKNKEEAAKLGINAKSTQFNKYINTSRYKALLQAVEEFDGRPHAQPENFFDPLMAFFQYNHQLNNRYKHLYRLSHNRLTYGLKGIVYQSIRSGKNAVKKVKP